MGRWMGLGFPSLWFQTVILGVFAKGLDIGAFIPEFTILVSFGVLFLVLARLAVRKQAR